MERIHVTVRARPLSAEEAKTSPWRISNNSIFVPNHPSKFEFDRIFGEDCKTYEVYQARTKEIVSAAVEGFNGTVFAYGQTNSGKTHTMRGSPAERGIIPLSVHDLFNTIHRDVDREFLLRMSYMEIYNEEINDLLAPEHRKLQIHENLERGIYVAGLREEIIVSPEQVLDLMEFGESHRHIGETNMNVYSSRSHTIFRMIIESRDRTEVEGAGDSCDAVRVSVLNLVDLAGSERAAKTGAEGVRLKEGSHINKSLMTLGTVIKKLSEGAESQGGHVPYRDSKLTRILQPSLGGNANTAIICNITLAQIHTDETKSSLQFASRALRVTNCAHVNEILTDAALLKRQKKEIEELRAKLQGSHSEHLEEEILNLRNTLLQIELERERIALELEEEKKAQAEWEKRVQVQAKQIENLSSMVLYSNRDEIRDRSKKEKRRDTWCPGKLSRESATEVYPTIQSRSSTVQPMRADRNTGPLLPFQELVNEVELSKDDFCKHDENCESNGLEEEKLQDLCPLLHVTNRRKVALRKKSLPGVQEVDIWQEDEENIDIQTAYEDLLIKSETQKTTSDIHIDCLTRKLAEVDGVLDLKSSEYSACQGKKGICNGDKSISPRELEAILVIKRLQEQIKLLEKEKSSSQQNLDSVVERATEQNMCAREQVEELHEELLNAQEDARLSREKLTSSDSASRLVGEHADYILKISREVQDIISEVENSKELVESVSLIIEEDFKTMIQHCTLQQNLIISSHEKLYLCAKQRISELESEKAISDHQFLEEEEYLIQIRALEKEILCLSSSSLVKEKENLRKDLEKTKAKLKETESKLKNAMQEKTKLEGEKAVAEREIKRLNGQNSLLERDISRHDSLAGRRRDSVIDRSSKIKDPRKSRGLPNSFDQTMQEDYKKLEVFAFELETKICSLEEELDAVYREKEEVICKSAGLLSELEELTERLNMSNSELDTLQGEISSLRPRLEEYDLNRTKMESSIKLLEDEKEELVMRLTDSLLDMEEERAIWTSKEKASIEAIAEKARLHNDIISLSEEMLEVRNDLDSCREECRVLKERLTSSEENVKREKECSVEKSCEIETVKNETHRAAVESKQAQEDLENQLFRMTRERDNLMTQVQDQKRHEFEADLLNDHCNELMEAKVQSETLTAKISSLEVKMHKDSVENNIQKAKLRMRLRGTQAKLDAFRIRYKEVVDESGYMNKKYEEATRQLKDKLASKGIEVLNMKKQLASVMAQ